MTWNEIAMLPSLKLLTSVPTSPAVVNVFGNEGRLNRAMVGFTDDLDRCPTKGAVEEIKHISFNSKLHEVISTGGGVAILDF